MRLGGGTVGLLQIGDAARSVQELSASLRLLIQVELSTESLDDLYAYFMARGVPVRVPPRDRGFERSMQCVDPDGFTIEFAEGRRGHNTTRTWSLPWVIARALDLPSCVTMVPRIKIERNEY